MLFTSYEQLKDFINNFEFSDEIKNNPKNVIYLYHLKKLEIELNTLLFSKLDKLKTNQVFDIMFQVNSQLLKLRRLREVINPKISISINKHTQTNIEYVAVKCFWVNKYGKKFRHTKSIGRLDYFTDITDKRIKMRGLDLIRPVLFEVWKEIYQ